MSQTLATTKIFPRPDQTGGEEIPLTSENLQLIVSADIDDLGTPGVIVEVDPIDAETLGIFEETALSAQDVAEADCDQDWRVT